MEKIKLSKSEVKAVKDSVAHWKRDVLAKLEKGIAIKDLGALIWADNSEAVQCQNEHCPLCRIYHNDSKSQPCVACPYYKKYGATCTYIGDESSFTGHWRKFRKNPCLETCNGMIKALEEILI